MMFLLLALLVGFAAVPGATAAELAGPARVVDAVTVEVSGQAVRLYGIVAPSAGVRCAVRKETVDCGRIAATALMDLAAAATVRCRIVDPDTNPPVARCTADGYDLSEGMVYTGWARPTAEAPARLHRVEETARSRDHGLWLNGFPPVLSTR